LRDLQVIPSSEEQKASIVEVNAKNIAECKTSFLFEKVNGYSQHRCDHVRPRDTKNIYVRKTPRGEWTKGETQKYEKCEQELKSQVNKYCEAKFKIDEEAAAFKLFDDPEIDIFTCQPSLMGTPFRHRIPQGISPQREEDAQCVQAVNQRRAEIELKRQELKGENVKKYLKLFDALFGVKPQTLLLRKAIADENLIAEFCCFAGLGHTILVLCRTQQNLVKNCPKSTLGTTIQLAKASIRETLILLEKRRMELWINIGN
jgi:hypothetical protein